MDTCKIATFNLLTACRDVAVVVVVVVVVVEVELFLLMIDFCVQF